MTAILSAGITYVRRNDLPEGTLLVENMNMTITDSTFRNLAAFGQASIILLNSQVFFNNVTFAGNYQSNAGAININQTSNVTIVNSVFNNNFGYQAGAIAVGCKPLCNFFLGAQLFFWAAGMLAQLLDSPATNFLISCNMSRGPCMLPCSSCINLCSPPSLLLPSAVQTAAISGQNFAPSWG